MFDDASIQITGDLTSFTNTAAVSDVYDQASIQITGDLTSFTNTAGTAVAKGTATITVNNLPTTTNGSLDTSGSIVNAAAAIGSLDFDVESISGFDLFNTDDNLSVEAKIDSCGIIVYNDGTTAADTFRFLSVNSSDMPSGASNGDLIDQYLDSGNGLNLGGTYSRVLIVETGNSSNTNAANFTSAINSVGTSLRVTASQPTVGPDVNLAADLDGTAYNNSIVIGSDLTSDGVTKTGMSGGTSGATTNGSSINEYITISMGNADGSALITKRFKFFPNTQILNGSSVTHYTGNVTTNASNGQTADGTNVIKVRLGGNAAATAGNLVLAINSSNGFGANTASHNNSGVVTITSPNIHATNNQTNQSLTRTSEYTTDNIVSFGTNPFDNFSAGTSDTITSAYITLLDSAGNTIRYKPSKGDLGETTGGRNNTDNGGVTYFLVNASDNAATATNLRSAILNTSNGHAQFNPALSTSISSNTITITATSIGGSHSLTSTGISSGLSLTDFTGEVAGSSAITPTAFITLTDTNGTVKRYKPSKGHNSETTGSTGTENGGVVYFLIDSSSNNTTATNLRTAITGQSQSITSSLSSNTITLTATAESGSHNLASTGISSGLLLVNFGSAALKTNGTIVYPLTSQINEADANEPYSSFATEFTSGKAFKDVSVNPKLKTTYVEAEHTSSGSATSDVVPSAIFTEIRKAPHGSSISNDAADKIGNRILPTNTTLTSYATNKEITPSYKVKVYDTSIDAGETNRKFVYSTIDDPASDTLGIDIENYDYFILINPEIYDSTTQTDTARPHFAKITSIVTFDEFGDGVDFSPSYPTTIPKGTNFEIFKGPAKTSTDIVAVSYGLRGDNQASTDNYDVLNLVAKPTFYFYNDRLEQEDQLDYMEKYTLTRLRWFTTLTNIGITEVDTHTQYQEGSSSVLFTTTSNSQTAILCQGMSIFNSSNNFLGNIKHINGNDFQLDFARIAIAGTSTNFNVKIGKGIQNVVFRTEPKMKGTIENIGRNRLDATLVDYKRTNDDGDINFNPFFWHKAFPEMKRHETDSTTASTSTLDGNMNGPSTYITADPRPRRNDIVPMVQDVIVNSPQNKMSKMCRLSTMNNSGMLPYKYKQGQTLKVMRNLFSDRTEFKRLPFKVSRASSTTIQFIDMDDAHDYKLSEKLPTDSIVLVDGYYYVVNTVNTKSGTTQSFTVKANKTVNSNTFTVSTAVHDFSNESIEIAAWTGVLNTQNFSSDTDVHYSDGNRLTVSGTTIPKETSKLYNSKIIFNVLNTHQNDVDYVDKNMEYVKLQDADRKFYQNNSDSRFYYYEGGYSLQEETFDGIVELIETEAENGVSVLKLEGRDNSASLLNTVVNENLLFTQDMVHSTLNPIIPFTNTETLTSVSVSDKVITHASSDGFTPVARDLLFTRTSGVFIGEVASATATAITLTHKPLANLSSTTNIYYYNPFTEVTYLSGTKALGSNPSLTSTTDFRGISDKGMVLQDSFSFDTSLTRTKLEGTSNNGSYLENGTLGYDIRKPISINNLSSDVSSDDSIFACQLSRELGTSVTPLSMMTFASERFAVLDIIEKDDGGARMRIAPTCPVVMGRVENNTSDTRSGYSFYLVNNGINDGGFLHRFDTGYTTSANLNLIDADDIYTPRETFRYWDLQKFSDGTIMKELGGIYNRSSKQQKIGGYAIAYPIKANGDAPSSTTLSQSSKPLFGSNMLDSNYTLVNTTGSALNATTGVSTLIPPSKTVRSASSLNKFLPILDWNNFDGKAQAYELFATGDLYPYSKLRYNNIGNQTLNFDNLACLLESEGGVSDTEISHSSYDGTSKSVDKTDNNFERASIKSANKTTNQMKRFGVARLVEATFDWHFNPVDADALENTSQYEELIGQYPQMKTRESSKDNLTFSIASNTLSLTWTNGGTLTISAYSSIFNANTGELLATTGSSSQTISSGGSVTATNHVTTTTSSTPAYIISEYARAGQIPYITKDGFDSIVSLESSEKMDMSRILLMRPNYKGTDSTFPFKYALLKNGDGTPDEFDPPAVLLPFIFTAEREGNAELQNATKSPYHDSRQWSHNDYANPPYNHFSRVLAALLQNYKGTGTITTGDKYGFSDDIHPYENCIAVFRDIKKISSSGPDVPDDMFQTSTIVGTREVRGDYEDYATGTFTTAANFDQHSTNTMVYEDASGQFKAVTGTHALRKNVSIGHALSGDPNTESLGGTSYFLDTLKGSELDTSSRVQNHASLSTNSGGVYSARMLLKPFLNTTDANVSISSRTVTIDLDDTDSEHSWLEFVPNLEGYYLVSQRGVEDSADITLGNNDVTGTNFDTLSQTTDSLNIQFMAKIVSHTHTTDIVSDTSKIHTLVLDRAITTNIKPYFRLMRLAETTFRDTPNEIVFNQLFDTGLDYTEKPSSFKTGKLGRESGTDNYYSSEGVYSAYVLLNLDTAPASTAHSAFGRTFTVSYGMLPYTNGDTFEVMVTDGKRTDVKTMTVDYRVNDRNNGIRRGHFKLTYDGVLNGDGVVSFGEIINLQLRRKPDLQNITACHVGTSMVIGEEIETHMDKIIRDSGLTSDLIQTQSEFTGNIVSSVSNNVITCKATVENLEAGDVIYTHEGYPIGVVGSVSGSDITVTDVHTDADVDLWFNPVLNDEIIKRNRKTFIATNNFNNKPAYETLNEIAGKKGLDFKVKDKKVVFRDLNSAALLRKQRISYKTHTIFSVKKNSSLFAKANKVTVVGDRIQTTLATDEEGTHITFVDPSIRNISGVLVKAAELLSLHNTDSRKITLNVEKTGLETLEAGDVVYLDFPQYDIPAADYIIFEIENVLASTLSMTVGTFDKTIAERLSEIGSQQRSSSSTLFTRNSEEVATGKLLLDSISLKTTLVQYTITGTGETSNMGFDDLVGFGETVGFETTANQVIGYYTSED